MNNTKDAVEALASHDLFSESARNHQPTRHMEKHEKMKSWIESYIKGVCASQAKLMDEAKEMLELTKEWVVIEKENWKDPDWTIYSRTDGKLGISVSASSPGGCYLGFQGESVESEELELWTTWESLADQWSDLEVDDYDTMIDCLKKAKREKCLKTGRPYLDSENAAVLGPAGGGKSED